MVSRKRKKLELRDTADFTAMRMLALESGLEDGPYDHFVKACGFYDGSELVACAGLKEQKGVFSVECVAVKEGYRNQGLGRVLVGSIEKQAAARGARRIWAVARAPEFFEKIGYGRASPDEHEGPSLKACLVCKQYLRNCNPSIVVKVL